MDKIIRTLLDKVEVLPLSPTLLPKLLPKLSDVDTNFDEVVEIIAMDPALTAKLLQICNSAFFGHESEVTSVAEAVNRVGYQSVYLLVAMLNGSNCFPWPSPVGVEAGKLWQHSIITAFNTKFIAESAGADGNLLFTAGLLHDIGKVILGQAQPEQAAGLFRQPSDAASTEHELAVFGCTHADVGATLLERWKLPAQLALSVRHHHHPKSAQGFRTHRGLHLPGQSRQPQPGAAADCRARGIQDGAGNAGFVGRQLEALGRTPARPSRSRLRHEPPAALNRRATFYEQAAAKKLRMTNPVSWPIGLTETARQIKVCLFLQKIKAWL